MYRVTDLRSDTVTRPTPAMRRAMAEAAVGDDVLGDDPTVRELETVAANHMGKEAALFMPSGTMSNSVAIRVHTKPGDEVLLDWNAHSLRYEAGAPAVVSGVVLRQFRSIKGVPDVASIEESIQQENLHCPGTALIVLENTHNVSGGAVIPIEVHRRVYELAKSRGVAVHLDGARLFNASVASQVPVREFAASADSVTFCLSKGLGCPVGALLCGKREFIEKARRVRKMLGGGMRQVGILAAAGLYALEHNVERLQDDHRRARTLAETLADLPGVHVDLETVQTNMVYFQTERPAREWVDGLQRRGVLCLALGERRIRLVTHLDVDDDGVAHACEALKATAAELKA